jgi:hypothetical protein
MNQTRGIESIMKPKADMLKKVTITISPEAQTAMPHKGPAPLSCEFIYGIGPQGLTPFEYALAGKTIGDEFCITVDPSHFEETFQHLPVDIPKPPNDRTTVVYTIRVVNIASADNREIVGAMANLSACTDCCGH